jgi:predicted amidohydrolase
VFVATSDRWGVEAKDDVELRFIGRSQIVSPRGERLASLGEAEDGVLVVDVDPLLARDKQVTEHNHLYGDRAPALYVGTPLEP